MHSLKTQSLVVLGALLSLSVTALAQTYVASLDGLQEVPANASPGSGVVTAVLTGNTLVVSGSYSGLQGNTTASHIHAAPAGSNGGVLIPLVLATGSTSGTYFEAENTYNLTAAQIGMLQSDGLYVNVHSTVHPGGEIRGQFYAQRVSDTADQPLHFELAANHPNPFNPTTTLAFSLDHTASVRLSVFDIMGREVAVLNDGLLGSGEHQLVFNADGLSSGTYFYRLDSEGRSETRKMLLLK